MRKVKKWGGLIVYRPFPPSPASFIQKATIFIPYMTSSSQPNFFPWKVLRHLSLDSKHWSIRFQEKDFYLRSFIKYINKAMVSMNCLSPKRKFIDSCGANNELCQCLGQHWSRKSFCLCFEFFRNKEKYVFCDTDAIDMKGWSSLFGV